MPHTDGLPGIYFVRPEMLEKKRHHTHIIKGDFRGLSKKREADFNRLVWR
jgi:hypothetical protein